MQSVLKLEQKLIGGILKWAMHRKYFALKISQEIKYSILMRTLPAIKSTSLNFRTLEQ